MQQQNIYDAALASIDRLVNKIKPETSTRMKSAIVAFYTAGQDRKIRYSSQICLMHLDFDRQLKATFLRFYHLEMLSLLFEVELYFGFMENYRVINEENNLWGFDIGAQGGVVCVQFRNQIEASLFAKKIQTMAPKRSELIEISKRKVQEELKKRKENSLLGRFSKMFRSSSKNVQPVSSVVLIVNKSNSVTFDNKGNFITDNLSPEWQQIIKKSGLALSDLKDKQIAKVVLEEAVLYETKRAAQQNPSILKSTGFKIQDLQYKEQLTQDKNAVENRQNTIPQVDILPIPILDLPPPQLSPVFNFNVTANRQKLIQQLGNNQVKVKQIKANNGGVQIDASSLNKQQRNDLADQIKRRLMARKAALNRRISVQEQINIK